MNFKSWHMRELVLLIERREQAYAREVQETQSVFKALSGILESLLPHLPDEQRRDVSIYLNIMTSQHGTINRKKLRTVEEQNQWILEQLEKIPK